MGFTTLRKLIIIVACMQSTRASKYKGFQSVVNLVDIDGSQSNVFRLCIDT